MLGYVKIDKGELKVREYEVYCGYYCGICKSIGRRYGQLPRMALSYDAAFLAILLASIEDAPDAPLQEHCVVHPIKKKTMIYNRAVDYAGDVMQMCIRDRSCKALCGASIWAFSLLESSSMYFLPDWICACFFST